MSENNDPPPDPAHDAVANLLRSALRIPLSAPRNRGPVHEYIMERLLGPDRGATNASGAEDPNTSATTPDHNTQNPEAQAGPSTTPPQTQPDDAGAAGAAAAPTDPARHILRGTPIMFVSYSFGNQPPPAGRETDLWNFATDATREVRQAREARSFARAAYRSRSESRRRSTGDRARERSPMRREGGGGEGTSSSGSIPGTSGSESSGAATGTPLPENPLTGHLPGVILNSPFFQRFVRNEDGTTTTEEDRVEFTPGGITHRADGTTTATFTIPNNILNGGGMGGARPKPKASRRVIRNLETLSVSEAGGQSCPICYDAFDEKPLGWDAIIAKLAEIESEEERKATADAAAQREREAERANRGNSETQDSRPGTGTSETAETGETAETASEALDSATALPQIPFVIPRIPELAHAQPALVTPETVDTVSQTTSVTEFELGAPGSSRAAEITTTAESGSTEATAGAGAETTATADSTTTNADEEEEESSLSLPESHVATKMPCGHIFGHLCICEWLRSNNSCPLCRTQVESESEYLRATGQQDESRSGGFFDLLFNFLPRVLQEIEEDRRLHGPQQGAASGAQQQESGSQGPTFVTEGSRTHSMYSSIAEAIRRGNAEAAAAAPPTDVGAPGVTADPSEGGVSGIASRENSRADGATATSPAVHQPIPGVYVYHRPADFFRQHEQQQRNRVSDTGNGAPESAVGAARESAPFVGQETLQEVGTDGGDTGGSLDNGRASNDSGVSDNNGNSNNGGSNNGESASEVLRSRLVEPIRRMFRGARENDRHHPYRRGGGSSSGGGSGGAGGV